MYGAKSINAVDCIETGASMWYSVTHIQGVAHDIVAHLVALRPVVIDGFSPWSPVSVREIRAEVFQVIPFWSQMVVDYIAE